MGTAIEKFHGERLQRSECSQYGLWFFTLKVTYSTGAKAGCTDEQKESHSALSTHVMLLAKGWRMKTFQSKPF